MTVRARSAYVQSIFHYEMRQKNERDECRKSAGGVDMYADKGTADDGVHIGVLKQLPNLSSKVSQTHD